MTTRLFSATVALFGAIAVTSPIAAQEAGTPSPYAGQETREIKALSAAEIEGYLGGMGMGFALPAELNGYPGPLHVLELGDRLELSPEQRASVEAIFRDMRESAIEAGKRFVDAERALDQLFASGAATEAALAEHTEAASRINGELRTIHLLAHIATRELLSAEQIRRYDELRGYTGTSSGMDHSSHTGHGENAGHAGHGEHGGQMHHSEHGGHGGHMHDAGHGGHGGNMDHADHGGHGGHDPAEHH